MFDSMIIDDKTVLKKVDGGESNKVLVITRNDGQFGILLVSIQKTTDNHVDEAYVTNELVIPTLDGLKSLSKGIAEHVKIEENLEP
ncbi:hypothetical protein COU91_01310 [Candidatus Saccharibacteria bacterium CG10_big_fil_rev_8_21_14_0_10_47_8]|nr:MAG: hypothetical protein COU91_01310 [Candidatus Saccharibacteria bacterium CG10_big_fil_rev_8_21_14_0_10_47_8]